MKKFLFAFMIFLSAAGMAFAQNAGKDAAGAQEIDENEIFSQGETVKAKETVIDDQVGKSVDKNSLSFTGFLNARSMYDMNREWLSGNANAYHFNSFNPYIQGNFSLDARLTGGHKAFMNVSANYYPNGTTQYRQLQKYDTANQRFGPSELYLENTTANLGINEMFVDLNILKTVYFRFGKQNLVWGTGLLWVPTDLVNIDKKNILDPSQVRQGSYGMKMHVPFGTRANLYTYLKLDNVTNFDQLTFAAKFELLLAGVEMAISTVLNQYKVPVYGFNITASVFRIDFRGEVSISYGDNTPKLNVDALSTPHTTPSLDTYYINNQVVAKMSAGLGRSFELFSVPDRLRIDFEFFYNSAGYDYNSRVFGKTMTVGMQQVPITQIFASSLYTPNYYGMYYLGAFITLTQVGTSDLSMGLNYIINLSDYSSVLSYTANYMLHYNLTLTLMINGYIGYPMSEFTTYFASSNSEAVRGMSAELMVKLNF